MNTFRMIGNRGFIAIDEDTKHKNRFLWAIICVKNSTTNPPRKLDLVMGDWSYDISIFPCDQVRLKKNGEEVPREGTDGFASSSQQTATPIPLCSKHVGWHVAASISNISTTLQANNIKQSSKKLGQVSVLNFYTKGPRNEANKKGFIKRKQPETYWNAIGLFNDPIQSPTSYLLSYPRLFSWDGDRFVFEIKWACELHSYKEES